MKILFITFGNPDYLSGALLHGLCTLKDTQVYITRNLWFMYEGNDSKNLKKIYGKGFSYANRIPKDKKKLLNSDETIQKIKTHFFDVIIYANPMYCLDFLDIVKKEYDHNRIVFLDGGDYDFNLTYMSKAGNKVLYFNPFEMAQLYKFAKKLTQIGIVFKRELRKKDRNIMYPISFAIPEENIVNKVPKKQKKTATIIPGDTSTYIFDEEEAYFKDYRISMWGYTCKKAGWDCLRHYEILANGCIPYFYDIDKCPETILVNFPKEMIKKTNKLYENSGDISLKDYNDNANELLEFTRKNLTTHVMAMYVLNKIGIEVKE